MTHFTKYVAAAGLAGAMTLASGASFAQVVGADPAPYGYGVGTYGPYATYGAYGYGSFGYPIYQYRGGPRSPYRDIYYWNSGVDQYGYGTPYGSDMIGPR
jgi:hypothetical protein